MTTTNTYTVTIADASAHTVAQAGVPGPPNTPPSTTQVCGKLEAALAALQHAISEPNDYAAFVVANTWTITVTQP